MRLVPLFVLLAGCDGVFGLDHIPDRTDAGAVEVDARAGCVVDTFSRGLIGFGELWNREQTPPSSDVVIDKDQVAIKVALSGSEIFGYAFTNRLYDLTGATISIRVDQVIGSGDAETWFEIITEAEDYYEFSYSSGMLTMRLDANQTEATSVKYDPDEHRYWRLAHALPRDVVAFSTSRDGVAWTERYAIPAALSVRSMYIQLGAGIHSGSVTASESRYDDFELCKP